MLEWAMKIKPSNWGAAFVSGAFSQEHKPDTDSVIIYTGSKAFGHPNIPKDNIYYFDSMQAFEAWEKRTRND